jgi:superfamily I DNA and/or RNA helicase
VCVGDEHQLPPYAPNAFNSCDRGKKKVHHQPSTASGPQKVKGLLDVSALSVDNDEKIQLTTQYRVPHDIADLLNARIYKGNYHTAHECKAPRQGFQFVHVSYSHESQKYVNDNEIQHCVDLVRQLVRDKGTDSIMVLTPVRKYD